jgi:DNA-binding NarL/FixJ family response regulator
MRLVIVDDHRLVIVGLRQLFDSCDDIEIVGEADSGAAAVELVRTTGAEIVMMDLSMHGMNGVDATRAIKEIAPTCAVVVFTSSDASGDVTAAFDAGADGYLLKDADPDEIIAGLRLCLAGGTPMSTAVAARRTSGNPVVSTVPTLTQRETEILRHLVKGRSNQDIARDLQISESTVKAHCSSLFQRTGATSRTQAAMWATQHLPGLELVEPVRRDIA